ncbi:sigma-70 family RNA polymerase sigma factor [Pantoea vagans]|uniref:sigma-70 family RNA polymerase sigma factor n=1 Tax=Pantoea vagans TaxID=470934 RepID=UPI0023B19C04|nr:sigma-70 family RNA polymerase sigma factor [Pantoea vagans]MDE8557722.1 sigma-70 family RNA polymerase sigma factor [Pantoea vagans]MDE8577290.1 sigma-70 family RNA polymerase sigma factor [Pantoea vagans]
MSDTDQRAQHWPALMARAQAGDKAAYNQLLKAMVPAIRALVCRKIGDEVLAEDVIQDTLLAIHRVRHTYDPQRPILPWVAAIASARTIDALRQHGRRREVQDDEALQQRPAESAEASADPDILSADPDILSGYLDTLPLRQREIVESVHLREQSLAQAAAETHQSLSAVKSLLHRAMVNLRKYGRGHHEKS